MKGTELSVLQYTPQDMGIDRKVVITGMSNINEKDMLEMYFENKKRSGGGEIENFECCQDMIVITFQDVDGK